LRKRADQSWGERHFGRKTLSPENCHWALL
jgi:hypothetical protein